MLDIDHQPQLALGPGRPEDRPEAPVPTSPQSRDRTALFERHPAEGSTGGPLFSTGEIPVHGPDVPVVQTDPSDTTEPDDDSVTLFVPPDGTTAVIRLRTSPTDRLCDLPIFSRFAFDPRRLRQTAGCRRLTDLDPTQVVEVSTVVPHDRSWTDQDRSDWSEHGLTGDLLVGLLRSAMTDGHRIWLIAAGDPLVPFLEVVAGESLLHRVGRRRLGSQTNAGPWCVDPLEVVNHLLDIGPGDERHWMTMTLAKALGGVRTSSSGTDRELRSRGIDTEHRGLLRRIPAGSRSTAAAILLVVVCIVAPVVHVAVYRKPPPLAPLWVIAGLVLGLMLAAVWNRHLRSREDRELGHLLLADSVVDRVEVDRGEVEVL